MPIISRAQREKNAKKFCKDVRTPNGLASGKTKAEIDAGNRDYITKELIYWDVDAYEESLRGTGLSDKEIESARDKFRREKLTELFLSQGYTLEEITAHFAGVDSCMKALSCALSAGAELERWSKNRAMRYQANLKDDVAAYLTAHGIPLRGEDLDIQYSHWVDMARHFGGLVKEWKRA